MSLIVNQARVEIGPYPACFNLNVATGSLIVIAGASGQGKTSLLETIAGFMALKGGCISFAGKNVGALPPAKREVGYLFQNDNLFSHLCICSHFKLLFRQQKERNWQVFKRGVLNDLQRIGIKEEVFEKYPQQLSGGEISRVGLILILSQKAPLMLFDEPFAALDEQNIELCLELMNIYREKHGLTMIVVSHQLKQIEKYANQVLPIEGIVQYLS